MCAKLFVIALLFYFFSRINKKELRIKSFSVLYNCALTNKQVNHDYENS